MMEYEVLKNSIRIVLQVYDKEIQPEAEFETTLGADSIDMAQIFKLVEDELDIELKNVELENIVTVEDAHQAILKATAEK
ncbi:MAG: acyl carrier protein [Lachnospiraceae bacterium]|nr:acyl carrier protein [Lachnospiraceae bacterium]